MIVAGMKPSGLFLAVAGVWVLCQVFAGEALERLRILGTNADSRSLAAKATAGILGTLSGGLASDDVANAEQQAREKAGK